MKVLRHYYNFYIKFCWRLIYPGYRCVVLNHLGLLGHEVVRV